MGMLDGKKLFRFGLMYKRGGGIEEHLNAADHLLLERNKVVLLRAFIKWPEDSSSPIIESIGKGQRIWIPIERLGSSEISQLNLKPFIYLLFPFLKGTLMNSLSKLFSAIITKFRFLNKPGLYCNYKNLDSLVDQLYEDYAFDLAVFHTLFGADELEVIYQLIKLDIPISIIYHFDSRRLNEPLVKMMAKKATAIGAVSTAGVPSLFKDRLYHIVESVDAEYFNINKAAPVNLRRPDKLIFMPARIHPRKGQLDAIHAFYLLKQKGIMATLAFAGRIDSHPYYEQLKKLIHRLDLNESIQFLGNLNKEQLRDWYAASDIVILPSYSEGLGRILLEAQVMKRPVVAYNVGGVSEAMIDGLTGFLVKEGDISAFSSRLEQLILDDDLRLKMGEAGRAFTSEKFSLQRMVESHEALYLRALSKPKG